MRRQLRRGQVLAFFQTIGPCLIGIEACASAHHWARQLMAIGHEVRLMPPAYVKAYLKRGKTDAADAEAIAEAVTRPTMRFVAVKSKAQQAVLMLHKSRDLLVRQRTMLINALRGHLGEYGLTAPQGPAGVQAALKALREEDQDLPDLARAALRGLAEQLEHLGQEIGRLERRILDWHRQDETSRRLATIPGIGPITASAMAASAPDPRLFRSASSRRRGDSRPANGPAARTRGLGRQSPRTQEAEGRRRGLGQQDGSHRLDPDGATGGQQAHGGLVIGPAFTQDRRRRRRSDET